jgi:hypothetical protein
MADIQEMANQVNEFATKRAARQSAAARYLQIVIAVCAAIVTTCHFADFNDHSSISHAIGFFLSIFVGLSAVFLIVFNGDPDETLELARKATDIARTRQAELREESNRYDRTVNETAESVLRASDLYVALTDMQTAVCDVIANPGADEVSTISLMLEVGAPALKNAAGFSGRGHWTIAIFKAEAHAPPEPTLLRCVAQARSVKCDISQARVWPEGVGVAGISYATGEVKEVPDLAAPSVGNLFAGGAAGGLRRPDDDRKYRSIVAIPVEGVDVPGGRPWGIVAASSDRAGHFNSGSGSGLHPLQAVLALANIVELAIKVKSGIASRPQPAGNAT